LISSGDSKFLSKDNVHGSANSEGYFWYLPLAYIYKETSRMEISESKKSSIGRSTLHTTKKSVSTEKI
jgi:hypothetical protein